jgi:hypothetical protein
LRAAVDTDDCDGGCAELIAAAVGFEGACACGVHAMSIGIRTLNSDEDRGEREDLRGFAG